jgi:hypothetical protein
LAGGAAPATNARRARIVPQRAGFEAMEHVWGINHLHVGSRLTP